MYQNKNVLRRVTLFKIFANPLNVWLNRIQQILIFTSDFNLLPYFVVVKVYEKTWPYTDM